MNYNLRPATLHDLDELEFRYEQVMRPYVELTHAWDPGHFRKNFEPAQSQIVTVDGHNAGLFRSQETRAHIRLLEIQLWPEFQNQGIGTAILQTLISRANHLRLPILLRVLNHNPARRLYLRLGFVEVELLENAVAMRRDPQ